MPKPPRPWKLPPGNPWVAGAAGFSISEEEFTGFIQHTDAVLGTIFPLKVACTEPQSSRGRLKRRPPPFHPDSGEHVRPRKRTARTPFYVPPTFDDPTEHAIHESSLDFCERRLQRLQVIAPRAAGDKRKRQERLFLKLRLAPPTKDAEKAAASRASVEKEQVPKRERVPDAIDIPRRKRAYYKAPKTADGPLPKLWDELEHKPPKKIGDALHIPAPPRADDVLPLDVPESPKTPLEHILHFARRTNSTLAKIEKHERKDALKKRTSLATFNGCSELSKVSLSAYLRALTSVHLEVIRAAVDKGKGSELVHQGLDTMKCEMTDEQLADRMSRDGRASRRRHHIPPPHIAKTIDVVQLVFRLWQKMFIAEESLSEAFLQRWYASGVNKAVSTLAFEILMLWYESANISERDSLERSELVEFCVRLLTSILSYELSPFSDIWENVKSGLVFRPTADDGEPWLPKILDMLLYLVACDEMAPARDCRVAVSELCQLYVVRYHCPFPEGSDQRKSWEAMRAKRTDHLEALISDKNFWSTAVNSAIQLVRKQEQSDAAFAVAFLDSLLSEPVARKSLVQKQTTHREGLLGVLAKLLERLGRHLLSSFIEIERSRRNFPGLASSVDLIRKLMTSAVLQRELISGRELERKKSYLDAITNILSRLTKFVPGDVEDGKLMECARQGAFSNIAEKLQKELPSDQEDAGLLPELSDGEAADPQTAKDCAVARHKALAFGAWLIGSLGKSMEDGSRDMTQMNGLQILMASRFNSIRTLKKLWGILFKIQTGLEQRIPDELVDRSEKPHQLLTADERNHFSMAMEAVRLRVMSDLKDRSARGTPEDTPKQSSSEGESRSEQKTSETRVSLPDVTRLTHLRRAVATADGYEDLDDDPHMLEQLEKTLENRGEQILARYDPDSETVTQWIRLQKKNLYVDDARDLLDKADKTVGQRCSCMPGNPTKGSTDSQMRIACSNNLCENRSTHVECAPGQCGAGSYCQNQRMQKMQYAKMKTVAFPGKGVGMVADEDIPAGSFIGEYQGEVISKNLFKERKKEYEGERHFYFMTLTGKLVIDASRKSQSTRFVNHSCEPNAETQKWNAGGEPRVAIFALRDIRKSEEITFDYGARSLANDTVPCLCGTKSCRGFLTVSKKPDVEKHEEEEVMFDTSEFVKIGDDMTKRIRSVPLATKDTKENEDNSKTNSEKLRESVQEKIRRGKKDISLAEDLSGRRAELLSSLSTFDESGLSVDIKKRLSEWEVSVRQALRKSRSLFSLTEAVSKPETRMRIPRRPEIPRQESFLETYLRKDNEERNSLKTGVSRRTGPPRSSPFSKKPPMQKPSGPKPSPPSRPDSGVRHPFLPSSQHNGYRTQKLEEVKSSHPTLVDMQEAHAAKSAPPAEQKPSRRRGPIPAFLPTAPKVKKPLPKPRFAEKAKPKRNDSDDDDSMDNYSVASSAEPIFEDDAPLSPSDLPDGLGACSDDEFVAAPPIGATAPRHRDDERIDPRSRNADRREGIEDQSRQRLDTDGRRLSAANSEVLAGRHRDKPDRPHRWPERDTGESDRIGVEFRDTRAGSANLNDRDEPRPSAEYRPHRSGPEDDWTGSPGHLATAHDSQERLRPGARPIPHPPTDSGRHPEGRHQQGIREPLQRPYRDRPEDRHEEGIREPLQRLYRDRPEDRHEECTREPLRRSYRDGPQDRHEEGIREPLRRSYHDHPKDRREEVIHEPLQRPYHDHFIPRSRDGNWDGPAPPRFDRGRPLTRSDLDKDRDRRDHTLRIRPRDERGSRGGGPQLLDPGRSAPDRRELSRPFARHVSDMNHGVPLRRGGTWSDDMGRGLRHGDVWKDGDVGSGVHPPQADRWNDDFGRGPPPRRAGDLWSTDGSPGRHPRGRDRRGGDMNRGRPPWRDDLRGDDRNIEIHAGRRDKRVDDIKHALPLGRGDMRRDEGMHSRYNRVLTEQHVMDHGPHSRHRRHRTGPNYAETGENRRSSRFAHPDERVPGSTDSRHGLSDGKEPRKADDMPATDCTGRPDDSKDDSSKPDQRDQARASHSEELPPATDVPKPPARASMDALPDGTAVKDEDIRIRRSEVRQKFTRADVNDDDGSRIVGRSSQPSGRFADGVKATAQGREDKPTVDWNEFRDSRSPGMKGTTDSDLRSRESRRISEEEKHDTLCDKAQSQQHPGSSNQIQSRTDWVESSRPPGGEGSVKISSRPESPPPRLPVTEAAQVTDRAERRGAFHGTPKTQKSSVSSPRPGANMDRASNVAPSKMHAATALMGNERGAVSHLGKVSSRGSMEERRDTLPLVDGKQQKDGARGLDDGLKQKGTLGVKGEARSKEDGSQGTICKSASAQLDEVRGRDASASQDAIGEKNKPVMRRIGRRSGDGKDQRGNGLTGREGIRTSRSGGSFRSRHGDGSHEQRKRPEGPNEHIRKRFRGDGVRSPRREGSHGSHLHRRRSGDMGGHRHSSGRNQRPHRSSDSRDTELGQGPRASGSLGREPMTQPTKSAVGPYASKSSQDLRLLIGGRKRKGGT